MVWYFVVFNYLVRVLAVKETPVSALDFVLLPYATLKTLTLDLPCHFRLSFCCVEGVCSLVFTCDAHRVSPWCSAWILRPRLYSVGWALLVYCCFQWLFCSLVRLRVSELVSRRSTSGILYSENATGMVNDCFLLSVFGITVVFFNYCSNGFSV